MDLSLDDIIKKKKNVKKPIIKRDAGNKFKKGSGIKQRIGSIKKPATNIDARNMIIQRKRSKIKDAREMLAEIAKNSGDARLKLLKKRKINNINNNIKGGIQLKTGRNLNNNRNQKLMEMKKINALLSNAKSSNFRDHRKQHLMGAPRGYIDYDMMESDEVQFPVVGSNQGSSRGIGGTENNVLLRRTVQNDIAMTIPSSMPPFPSFGRSARDHRAMSPNLWMSPDPFDCYEVPVRHPLDASSAMDAGMLRHVRNLSPEPLMPKKGILRSTRHLGSPPPLTSASSRRFSPDENSHLSYEMRARLERAPNPHESSGIFSKQQYDQYHYDRFASSSSSGSMAVQSPNGFRIVVSNLHNTVTQNDIKELFEDVGELVEARLVRPGVAEVIFKTLKDAEEAVDTYHNRQLDGLPMKCLLVNPRASNKPTAPALKPYSGYYVTSASSTASKIAPALSKTTKAKTPLEIDIDSLHKVLFRR